MALTNTVETVIRENFPWAQHRDVEVVFEHGQYWVSCPTCGSQWSVAETNIGLDYELVSLGDEYCDTHHIN